MSLVLGIDSSTQSTKVLLVDADAGDVIAERSAPHPVGTEVDPRSWLAAVDAAAGPLLERADAISVAGQQHGMVLLDRNRTPVRDALLWNDTRSASQARALIDELGGADACVAQLGSVPVASFTAAKLRWVQEHEPESAVRAESCVLPHDYVAGHFAEPGTPLFTDRGDATGTGYYSIPSGTWMPEVTDWALGHRIELPVLPGSPQQVMGRTRTGALLAAGTGDNMASALGVGMGTGDASISIGTSGVCSMIAQRCPFDATGTVTGFADATGRFLPMTTTINASRILETARSWLGVSHSELSELALESAPGAHGVVLLPYLDGERTPNRPDATATFTGLTSRTTRADLARAAVEALLCSLADGLAALERTTGETVRRVLLVGGGARSRAVQLLAPGVLGRDVVIPPDAQYTALGAARQAAWALQSSAEPPSWNPPAADVVTGTAVPQVLARYRELKELTASW